jgi:serine protease Do
MIETLTRTGTLAQELAELALRVQASVVGIRGDGAGFGAGVVWNDAGLVVTNHHVAPREQAMIDFGDGAWRPARVVARSERHDAAALQLTGDIPAGITPAEIGDARALRVGELVVAVGNPVGERRAVTLGIVSGAPRGAVSADERDVIRTAITLRPGNSGGALADVQGRVVGIPNMVVGRGLGIAVPSHVVQRMLDRADQPAAQPLGITGRWVELPARIAARHRAVGTLGLLVLEVTPGSRAERAGVAMGDVVVAPQAGREGAVELIAQIEAVAAGSGGALTIVRAGAVRRLELAAAAV